MTIDEAIEHIKEDLEIKRTLTSDYSLERNLVIWLEELKAIRNLDKTSFSDSYNKAIDDCLNIIENCCWKDSEMLVELVKELKGGGSSE